MAERLPQPNPEEHKQGSAELERSLAELPEEIDVLLEDVPEPQRQAVKAVLVGISSQRIWQGPYLPQIF